MRGPFVKQNRTKNRLCGISLTGGPQTDLHAPESGLK